MISHSTGRSNESDGRSCTRRVWRELGKGAHVYRSVGRDSIWRLISGCTVDVDMWLFLSWLRLDPCQNTNPLDHYLRMIILSRQHRDAQIGAWIIQVIRNMRVEILLKWHDRTPLYFCQSSMPLIIAACEKAGYLSQRRKNWCPTGQDAIQNSRGTITVSCSTHIPLDLSLRYSFHLGKHAERTQGFE